MENLTKIEKKVIEQSLLLAPLLYGRCKHLSFIVNRNKVISLGSNSYTKTHPLSMKFGHRDCLQHSELSAIVNFPFAPRELKRYDLYNVRLTKDFSVKLSRPCTHCFSLLNHFGIKNIYYTTDNGIFEKEQVA